MKTAELQGAALDWAVTLIEQPEACGYGVADWREQRTRTVKNGEYLHRWHQSWAQGGPIIDRETISLDYAQEEDWAAKTPAYQWAYGPTPLIAAMRCYVASKLGDEVEIPKELT